MADIVCVKIGRNKPHRGEGVDKLGDHLDLIEILPRKRDKNGNLLPRTMGKQADKHYLGLAVDMDHLDDKTFFELRCMLKSILDEETTPGLHDHTNYFPDTRETKYYKFLKKRKFKIDLTRQSFISEATLSAIDAQKQLRENDVNSMDMKTINRFDKVVSFEDFINMVVSKKDQAVLKNFIPDKYKKVVS